MKKENKFRGWFTLCMLFAVVIAFIFMFSPANIGSEVSLFGNAGATKTIESMIGDGSQESEIKTIVICDNGIGYVLKKDSKYKIEDITNNCDYHFYFVADSDISKLEGIISTYNAKVAEEGHTEWITVSSSRKIIGQSWFEKLLPYASVILVAVLGVILIKSILGANNKSFNFGKTKAMLAQNIKVRFSDVAGIDEEKEELQEVVEFLKNPQKFTALGAKIPKGILLVGLPGTGKTLLAKAIAGESNVPFFSISGSDFVEMFVGVGASRVRDLFEQAKREAPCIVFIDEIDAVGRQRGTGLGGGNDEREQTLNQLLVQMDGFEGNTGIIVIAATNRADVLDPALLRPGRFDRQIYINPPDVKGREMILKIHARNKPMDATVDYKVLARMTSGFMGADLENLLNEAAILAAKENKGKISMLDITESINKVLMGPQKRSRVFTQNDKRITACHESGHAIIGKVLPHCDVVQEVSIISRGSAAGYTLSRPDNDEAHMSKNKLLDNITMMLGGRVAEELLIKDISTGASNDIERASKIARKMVTEWGMSSKLGPVNLGSDTEVFLGRDYQNQVTYSEKTAADIDSEVKAIMEDCYSRAIKIVKDHIKEMNVMIDVLLEKETIYFKDVEMIMAGKSVEEVLAEMEKEETRNKARIELERAEAELEQVKKEQAVRIKTAEALKGGGVLSQEEIEKVKKDSDKVIKQAKEKVEKLQEKYNEKNGDEGNEQSNQEEIKEEKAQEKEQEDALKTPSKKDLTNKNKKEDKE